MAIEITNVGLVKAIFVQSTAPSNTDVIWKDTTVGLHKAYNSSTSAWETLVGFVLIDNSTIKRDGDGNLYVDPTVLPALSVANGSITLIKMADVPTGTIFYRKTAGNGAPEVQTLAQLKTDLGLTGTNSGDEDLTLYALKTYTINAKPLNGNIVLTPEDIGSPAGSGSSTGTNTGDETLETIKAKLLITVLSGDNTGDQTALTVPIVDLAEIFAAENVEDALLEVKLLVDAHTEKLATLFKNPYKISLVASGSVAGKIIGATYPSGWSLAATGDSGTNLAITHNLVDRELADVTVKYVDEPVKRLRSPFRTAFAGVTEVGSVITIEGLDPVHLPLIIHLFFS